MFLPPELIDHILEFLRDDRESLAATSLVAKAWTTWSQARIFEPLHLSPTNLQGWLKNIPPDADGPASYTRTLTLEEFRLLPWINPQYLDFPFSSLASFREVRSLSLVHWNATLFNGASPEPYFGHFGKSLHALSLRFCTLDPVTLFDLFSLLPNVQDLEIAYLFSHSGALETIPDVPEITPSFRGTLSLADLDSGHLILKALAALPLHFTTISIRGCTFYEPDSYQMLLASCRDTLVTLLFEKSYRDRPIPDVSLASCEKLEEVHALLRSREDLPRSLTGFLSSITSQKLRKISLSFMDVVGDEDSDSQGKGERGDGDDETETWGSLDTTLSHLAKQVSKVEGKLTLRLKFRRLGSELIKFDHLLSQFLEHGELEVHSTRVFIRCRRGRG